MSFRRPHTIPVGAHPLVQRLFAEMNAQRMTGPALADKAGIAPKTILMWRRRKTAPLWSIERCFKVLGYEITVVPAVKS